MEVGQSGQIGAIVMLIVTRTELGSARTQPLLKVELTALETLLRQRHVVVGIVGVKFSMIMNLSESVFNPLK